MELAYYKLRELLESELMGAELLKKSVSYEITDTAYVLYCTVECIEDIAVMQEFEYVSPD